MQTYKIALCASTALLPITGLVAQKDKPVEKKPPNVIYILADDLGIGFILNFMSETEPAALLKTDGN